MRPSFSAYVYTCLEVPAKRQGRQHASLKCFALSHGITRYFACRVPSNTAEWSGVTRREEAMWRRFLGLAAMPGALVLVAYKVLRESPRYLSVVGNHDEAVKVRMGRCGLFGDGFQFALR